MLEELKERVYRAHLALVERGLLFQTWGNASGCDRERGWVVIKPSGVPYDRLGPDCMVLVDGHGDLVEGTLNPSVDAPTHIALYNAFPDIGGVVHTHSHYATCFAQARRPIPCLGTTHADYFHGSVPVAEPLSARDVERDYERCIGESIAGLFARRSPAECPAALAANHGPFAWGATVEQAVEHAVVLEEVARMAFHTLALAPDAVPIDGFLLDKHFLRKHGRGAYYGQP